MVCSRVGGKRRSAQGNGRMAAENSVKEEKLMSSMIYGRFYFLASQNDLVVVWSIRTRLNA